MPIWSRHRNCWVVGWRVVYEPGETVTVVRGHATFEQKSQALAFVAKTNWSTEYDRSDTRGP